MTIKSKLALAFGALTLIILLISGFAVKALSDANNRFKDYVNGANARGYAAHSVREAVDARAIAARNLLLVTTPEHVAVEKAKVEKAHADVGKYLAALNELAKQPGVASEVLAMIAKINDIERQYAPVALDIVGKSLNNQRDAAILKLIEECRPLLSALVVASEEYLQFNEKQVEALVQRYEEDYAFKRNELIVAVLLSVVLAIVAGLLITRNLTRALGDEPDNLSAMANRVASGNLSEGLSMHHVAPGSVLAAMAKMQDSLTKVVHTVRTGAESVSVASTEIAQGNQELSSRTESQASALEQTASSMEQLGAQVKQNADSARQANQLAMNASTVATQGGEVVGQVVQTMKGINDASRKIADIISVIDGIAFQTNILALNAAVEAARAGEQGRGFAVVASEVRSLAGRSADAAKEIKSLISASVERVEQGTALVDKAGETMTEVVTSIRRVTDIMGEISAASSEQAAGVAQVGDAVSQMDQATQQNAALVEQMAAAAGSLKGQASELVQAVAVFKLGDNVQPSQASQAHTSAPQRHASAPRKAPVRSVSASASFKGNDRRQEAASPAPAIAKPTNRGAGKADTPAAGRAPALGAPTPKPASTQSARAKAAGGDDDWETF